MTLPKNKQEAAKMSTVAEFKSGISKIHSLLDKEKFGAALRELDSLMMEWPNQPALLVLRGELIQLQEEDGPPIDEAIAALKKATVLDARNADAWLELGYIQFSVQDDAKTADKSFVRSISAASQTLVSALIGRAGALEELGKKSEAFECLLIARYLQRSPLVKGETDEEVNLFDRFQSLVG